MNDQKLIKDDKLTLVSEKRLRQLLDIEAECVDLRAIAIATDEYF